MRYSRCPAENRRSLSRKQAAILALKTGVAPVNPHSSHLKSSGQIHCDGEVFAYLAHCGRAIVFPDHPPHAL